MKQLKFLIILSDNFRVLQNIEPLVSKTRFKEIESEMQNFKTNEGPVLQNILEQRYLFLLSFKIKYKITRKYI